MDVAVVGGGLAGALLALRLRQSSPAVTVQVFTGGEPARWDATAASGGLVRGFEPDPAACRLAAESLAELRTSPVLRRWAGYREIGSVFLPAQPLLWRRSVHHVERLLPGSVTVLTGSELTGRYPLRALPENAVGVVERHAGYLSPARLRAAVLTELTRGGTPLRAVPVTAVTPSPAVRLADGATRRFDAVVVAAGAWTPRLLAASGLPGQGFRVKHIQYSLHAAGPPGLGAFVDDSTGLYGRPAEDGSFLLGLSSHRWDVDPDTVEADPALAARALRYAAGRLAVPITPYHQPRTVAAFDCYHPTGELRLRPANEPSVALFTFSGGSGGAAKTVLAASQLAAAALLESLESPAGVTR